MFEGIFILANSNIQIERFESLDQFMNRVAQISDLRGYRCFQKSAPRKLKKKK